MARLSQHRLKEVTCNKGDAVGKSQGPRSAGSPAVIWHCLRHVARSCWVEPGLQPETVQTFVGHATLQMTMDIYARFPSYERSKAMDAIAKRLFT